MTIKCQICNNDYKMITSTHIKSHNMTVDQYILQFGKESLTSQDYRDQRSKANSGENNPNFGNKMEDSSKKNISMKNSGKTPHNKGKKLTDEEKIPVLEGIARREKRYESGELIRAMTGKHHTAETVELLSAAQIEYAKNNPEEMSKRAYKAIQTKIDNGVDIAFFRGKHHKAQSIIKIQQSTEQSRANNRHETNQRYLEKINLSNLTLLNDIDDHMLHLECNVCYNQFHRTRQIFQESKRNGVDVCDVCYPKETKHSIDELEIVDYLKQLIPNTTILLGNRTILYPLELDIYIPSLNLAIEYNGLYYHSELNGKGSTYHLYKTQQCELKGIRLIHIFEDEWIYKKDIVKERLKNLLKLNSSKIQARKCTVQEISSNQLGKFLNASHIQGNGRSNIRLGLFYNGELVQVMSFSKSNISRKQKYEYELNRMASKPGSTVIGGASKLFSYFIKKYDPKEIISYSDKRWNTGKVYESIGMKNIGDSSPNYWYINGSYRLHRYSLRMTENDDHSLTEWENRKKQGWDRIWDCGNSKWLWIKE